MCSPDTLYRWKNRLASIPEKKLHCSTSVIKDNSIRRWCIQWKVQLYDSRQCLKQFRKSVEKYWKTTEEENFLPVTELLNSIWSVENHLKFLAPCYQSYHPTLFSNVYSNSFWRSMLSHLALPFSKKSFYQSFLAATKDSRLKSTTMILLFGFTRGNNFWSFC